MPARKKIARKKLAKLKRPRRSDLDALAGLAGLLIDGRVEGLIERVAGRALAGLVLPSIAADLDEIAPGAIAAVREAIDDTTGGMASAAGQAKAADRRARAPAVKVTGTQEERSRPKREGKAPRARRVKVAEEPIDAEFREL